MKAVDRLERAPSAYWLSFIASEPGRLVFRPSMASGASVHLIVDVLGFFN